MQWGGVIHVGETHGTLKIGDTNLFGLYRR